MESSITTEYFQITKEYQQKYGKKTVLLMQVGAFFEVYGLKNAETGVITHSQIVEFSQICQLNVSEKKNFINNDPIVMAGFRDYTLEKYIQKLSENVYTSVVYKQEKDGKSFKRKFHSIHSAGTYISYDTDSSPQTTNNIMCVWINTFKSFSQSNTENLVCGVSVANIFTGKSFIFEYEIPFYDNPTTFDELERCVSIYSPSEIILITNMDDKLTEKIIQYSGMKNIMMHKYTKCSQELDIIKKCSQQKYIQHILSTFFGEECYQICSEFSANEIATQSYCFLLNFIQEHNPNLVKKIEQPIFNNTSYRMILANHTLKQLNIIDDYSDNSKYSSVLSFLNKCCTPMGKREFKHQLTNPTFDEEWLKKEYAITTLLLHENNAHFISFFRKQLVQIRDIEKICRQIIIKKIYPSSIYHLYKSIENIEQIYQCLYETPDFTQYFGEHSTKNANFGEQCSQLLDFIKTNLQIDLCIEIESMVNFEKNIIQRGVSEKLDILIQKYENSISSFHGIKDVFNSLLRTFEKSAETDYIKIHETDKSGFSLQITKKRASTLKTILSKITEPIQITTGLTIPAKEIQFKSASTTNDEIEINVLNKICKDILLLKEQLNTEIAKSYNEFLNQLDKDWFSILENIGKYITKIDVLQNKAYIAKEYNYVCPEIDSDVFTTSAYVHAYDLRHCLIEHIQQNEVYVPNDLLLGGKIDDVIKNGMLLYGTNAVGKTSLIRAIGIATIMAQSGLYVPCSRFIFKPYKSIYSRILGNDNIFKGLSTFAVEMSELRMILRGADEYSMILGDELCSGTETESALSIFTAGLMHLNSIKSTYIFATHFHEVLNYDEIKSLTNMEIKHMAVHFDREMDCLVYDRKLRDGPGNRMYGLEVCKSLYLPEEFLEKAYVIRNKYYPINQGELAHKTSVYNAKKVRGLCEICKMELSEEVHHLSPQKDADEKGFIGTFHKNHVANLAAVCEKCHEQLHAKGTQKIVRKKTTKGYVIG
jgi:DNA mismatch repair protein MutS